MSQATVLNRYERLKEDLREARVVRSKLFVAKSRAVELAAELICSRIGAFFAKADFIRNWARYHFDLEQKGTT